jgi:Tetratricopeptide repeat
VVTVSPHLGGLAPTIGRATELRDLRLSFQASNVQVLTGLGGVGKSSLARAYAQQHLDSYDLIWWIRAEDPASIDAEFRSMLDVLLPPGEAALVTDARTKAFDLLAQHPGPWLLILDDVPDAPSSSGLLPPIGNGHVLITSRTAYWPVLRTVQPLHTEAAVELLTTQSGDHDRDAAKSLADELGGLPLALTQAAGFVRTNATNLATYLKLYRDRAEDLHKEAPPADYPHTVATTWELAINRLSDTSREMLNVLAFYAPDAIPVHRLLVGIDELDRYRAIGELYSYSLITHSGTELISVHRLIQSVTRNQLRAELTSHEWASRARDLILRAFPNEPATATSMAVWDTLRTHAQALLDHLPPMDPDSLAIMSGVADWTGKAGDAARARDLFAEVVSAENRVLGAEHPTTMRDRHKLAYWTGQTGDSAEARDLLAGLLPIQERILGAEHPETLTTRLQLARIAGRAGDWAAARRMFAELVPIQERVLGAEHPDTLLARSYLARHTGQAGFAAKARDLLSELLPVQERVVGPEHPNTLLTRAYLAHYTGRAGDANKALTLLAELLPIRERVLGAEHRETLLTRSHLATWIGEAGDAAKARDMLAELFPQLEDRFGAEHPEARRTRDQLAYWTEMAEDS